MKILRHFEDVPESLRGGIVAIGNFDGVHRGHQALIAEARRQAEERRSPLAVLAFEPHPQEYFRPEAESLRLTPLRTKARLLAELGVDVLFALPFDAQMAGRSAPDFVQQILVGGLGASGVVVGRDFEFGKGRGGSLASLSYMGEMEGFSVTAFDTVLTSVSAGGVEQKVSSTNIRSLLKAARPQEAAKLLGRWWAIESRVEHGDKRGREFGFPTANMHLGHCLTPAFGIYAVRAAVMDNDRVVSRHDGVANFGIRPMYRITVPLLETFLFDFSGDLYGKYLSVELVVWLRPEAKFEGMEALIAQIGRDTDQARELLAVTPQTPKLDG